MITVRDAQQADYEAVRQLEEAVFRLHRQARPDYFHAEARYTRQEFEEMRKRPAPISLVAVCDGRVVGICFGKIEQTAGNSFCKSRKIAVVEDLFTLPEYRKRGVASRLLQTAREQAAAGGAETLELCVWSFNADALRLYEKLGMRVQYCRMEERLGDGPKPERT